MSQTCIHSLPLPLLLLLLLLLLPSNANACNLTEVRFATDGRLHRCVNVNGEIQWRRDAACWISANRTGTPEDVVLEIGDIHRDSQGRKLAECRPRYGDATLVWLSCFHGNSWYSAWETWTNSSGAALTCVGAHEHRSARVTVFGCMKDVSDAQQLMSPNSTWMRADGIELRCTFSGITQDEPRYDWLETVGCWLRCLATGELVRAPVDKDLLCPNSSFQLNKTGDTSKSFLPAASCWRRSRYSRARLRLLVCRDASISADSWILPDTLHSNSSKSSMECRLPKLSSARIIAFGCWNSVGELMPPGSVQRAADGLLLRCVYSDTSRIYDWEEIVGCWQSDSIWQKFGAATLQLKVNEKFCPLNSSNDTSCLAVCLRRRYRRQVAIVQLRCLRHVGTGRRFRSPGEDWVDNSGISRTCLPQLNQRYDFGAGAVTVVNGCSKNGSAAMRPGSLRLDEDQLVRECGLDERAREFKFDRVVGCWFRSSNGSVVQLGIGQSWSNNNFSSIASCRRRNRYSRVFLVADVCFHDKNSSLLNWSPASLALPGQVVSGEQCNSSYEGDSARWITFGCENKTGGGVQLPGSEMLHADHVIRRCSPNGRKGEGAEYSWAEEIGCWFRDHQGNEQRIMEFNKRMEKPSNIAGFAECSRRNRYSDPELLLFRCFSAANRKVFVENQTWVESGSGVSKKCVAKSRYSSSDEGVVAVDNGCWLEVGVGNKTETRLFSEGSKYYATKNRVLRCDFNTRSRKYEWLSSVACWTEANGVKSVLNINQHIMHNGLLTMKCHNYRGSARLMKHACEYDGGWKAALTTWSDSRNRYSCQPARVSAGVEAKLVKTHCITKEGQAISSSQTINGVEYLCMRVCGFLLNIRNPTARQWQFAFQFINNCHSVNMAIIGNIG